MARMGVRAVALEEAMSLEQVIGFVIVVALAIVLSGKEHR